MEVGMMQYPPGDSRMIDKIVHQLKSQGIFDQFRKECIADVDTKPAYQNLHQRVEGSVSGFLASQVWRPDLNKNQLRDSLRKHIHESGFLDIGVERIVDQVVNPKILTVFMPQVEDVVYKFLGIEKPKKGKENQNVYLAPLTAENLAWKEERKLPTLTDLLPKELEPISPESDTLKGKYDSDEDEVGFPEGKEEEDSSPPFEPIEEVNSRLEESSMGSHLSGISELTSHDSQHSHISFMISNQANNNSSTAKPPALDLSNNDSQLSKVSSGSRLSIVSLCEQDYKLSHNIETNDDSQQSNASLHVSSHDTQMSASMEFTSQENETKDGDVARDTCEDSSNHTNKLQDSSHSFLDGVAANEKSEKKVDNGLEKMCEDTPERKWNEKYANKNEISRYKSDENEDRRFIDKSENEPDVSNDKKADEKLEIKIEEKCEKKLDENSDKPTDEKSEKGTDEKSDKKSEEQSERKLEEISVSKVSGKCEENVSDEKYERRSDENLDKKFEDESERKCDDVSERRVEEKPERKYDEKSERKLDDKLDEKSAKRLDEKFERKLVEKPERKTDDKSERKSDDKSDKKWDDKCERKMDEKSDRRQDEKGERKMEEKHEKKLDERAERKLNEKSERRAEEKSERKSDEKPARKSDDRSARKLDEKSEKKLDDKLEKKPDTKIEKLEKLEKKSDDKSDKKSDDKLEKKPDTKIEKRIDDKHDKKQDKHRENREKSREKKDEKKRISSESKDLKKNDNSGHSSEGDRKRSDRDKYKKERADSRSKGGKEKTEKDGVKEKVKHEEKEIMKEKFKQEIKENKVEKDSGKEKSKKEDGDVSKRSDEKEKKVEKDSSKEKSKKEDGDASKHDKDTKKSRSDEKREREGKEKSKSEEKGRLKHDDKHKDKIKSESRDKDKSTRHDDKNSKEGSRSSSKESKDRLKPDTKDKGKDTTNKNDEKKNKEKSKHEEKTSKTVEKGSRKKEETESTKSSRTDHKSKDSGKKGKENKGKNITDDHRIHRDKRSDDRRSTDRDSNGQDRSVGSTTSQTNGNDSQRTQSRRDKSGSSSSNSSKSDSGGNSESSGANTQTIESSNNVEEDVPSTSKSTSPPSSLPFKKRPLSIQSDDEQSNDEYQSTYSGFGKLSICKIKKPKIAANIFEVKKIMMLRKSLAKKERRRLKELKRNKSSKEGAKDIGSGKKMSKPVVAKRRKLGDVEKSLRKEVDSSLSNKQIPEVESKEEDALGLKYFDSESIPTDSDFLAYVKRLVESDNLSEISTSSDCGSEASDIDIIRLSGTDLDDIVAAELGAKIIKTGERTEIVLDLPEDKVISNKSLPSLNSTKHGSRPMTGKGSKAIDPFSVIASSGKAIVRPCDTILSHNTAEKMEFRPVSVLSSSSDTSADDIMLNDGSTKKSDLRRRSSSAASTNSNKSVSEKIEVASNGLNTGRIPDSGSKLHRKKVSSRKRMKKETASISEMKPPEAVSEKRELRRSRKPSTRYSNKMFASYLEDEDLSCDAFSEERDSIILDDESPTVALNDVSKNAPDRVNSRSPNSSRTNKISFTKMKIPATITRADNDNSEREIVSEPSAGEGYDIKDNNNIDKGSSEDERGCGDGSMLNQDLILPTLRDLMVESGFRREDDKSDILPSLVGIGNSLLETRSNVGSSDKGTPRVETNERAATRRPKLGRSRRVGLGRPHGKRSSDQAGDDVSGNRTVTPPSSNMADFVMPLSPESDVSASSGEAKKSMLDSKVGDGHTDPSPSNSDEKVGQVSNSRLGDAEIKRNLRSGGLGTPGGRAQRYSSDDLYKPRPLFSQGSRRVRGRVSPSLGQDAVANCTSKRRASDITETPPPATKRKR